MNRSGFVGVLAAVFIGLFSVLAGLVGGAIFGAKAVIKANPTLSLGCSDSSLPVKWAMQLGDGSLSERDYAFLMKGRAEHCR